MRIGIYNTYEELKQENENESIVDFKGFIIPMRNWNISFFFRRENHI